MFGQLCHEKELPVPANEAWDLYGTIKLAKLVEKELPNFIPKIDVLEGDGGQGTLLKLNFAPGLPGPSYYKERFIKVDNENRIKVAEVTEGGYLDMGFTLYRVMFEVIEKDKKETSTVKATIEYEVKEEAAANAASILTIQPFEDIAEIAIAYFNNNKTDI